MAKMTKKDAIDLMAHFTLIAVSKNGEALIQKHVSPEQTDKMMKVIVSLFNGDKEKSETFIIKRLQSLLQKLEGHDLGNAKERTFIKGDVEE